MGARRRLCRSGQPLRFTPCQQFSKKRRSTTKGTQAAQGVAVRVMRKVLEKFEMAEKLEEEEEQTICRSGHDLGFTAERLVSKKQRRQATAAQGISVQGSWTACG